MAMQLNARAVALAFIGGSIALYLSYSYLTRGGDDSQSSARSKMTKFDSWKTKEFVEIPENIKKQMSTLTASVHERRSSFEFEGETFTIFFREIDPMTKKSNIPVILLHGASSSSEVWVETKTFGLLGAMGYRVIGVDLPGWGKSKGKRPNVPGNFLAKFLEHEGMKRPIIVSPSMSGSYSIHYLMEGKPYSCRTRARGFIPLAPVGTGAYKDAQYHKCDIPTMIVYGTKDEQLGLHSLNDLRNMANKEIMPMEGAKHACYIEKPDEWHYFLYNYILAVERHKD